MSGPNHDAILLLARCARPVCAPQHLDELARTAAAFTAWGALPAAAEAQGLAPLAAAHLQAAGAAVPTPIWRQLRALALRHAGRGRVLFSSLDEALAALDAASVEVRVLKGAALAHLVYAEPGHRPMSDLDLLVRPADLGSARTALAALGYSGPAGPTATAHRHLAPLTRASAGVTVQIELHGQLRSDYADLLLGPLRPGRRRPGAELDRAGLAFRVNDRPARTLEPTALLQHLCWHLVSHVNVWDRGRLIWAADIVGLAERYANEINWATLRRSDPAALRTLALLHHLIPLPAELLAAAGIRPGAPPAELWRDYRGWPKERLAGHWRATLAPAEWWLRMHYKVDAGLPLLWARWARHPLALAGQGLRAELERLGLPATRELLRWDNED